MRNAKLFSKIDGKEQYSPGYKAKLKETYTYFLKTGLSFFQVVAGFGQLDKTQRLSAGCADERKWGPGLLRSQMSLFQNVDNGVNWEIDPETNQPIPKPIAGFPLTDYRKIGSTGDEQTKNC